ncbi:chaperonin 10-like protein [Boletus edulis BED1]|uniref:Chaperonin 10-like protein n=1 Tax=Boletus edulis BED1 TaxID=1328754 RepID=A0AAD4C6R2_BOLED|nr:chaperonin 10-like protein [Boletus edulis BED1]
MTMTTQKALWLPNIGAEYTLGQNEIPEPGPGEVLVQLEAIALNPLGWKIQQSGFFMVKEYPAIVGEDGAGVVRKVGDGVTNLSEGDKVFFLTSFGNKYTTYQEYCLTDAQLAVKIPPSISFEQAASVSAGFTPFAVATYAQQPAGLGFTPPFEEGGLGKYANQPIVIMGGAGSLGQYGKFQYLPPITIQLAKLSGFSPIITTASLHNKDFLISLGATHVLDRTTPVTALRDQVAQITHVPLTYIFDAVSLEETQQTALSLLAPGGTLNRRHHAACQRRQRQQRVGVKFSIALTKWLEEGTIKPNKVEVLPGGLNGIVPGLRRLQTNSVSATKLVVRPAETV